VPTTTSRGTGSVIHRTWRAAEVLAHTGRDLMTHAPPNLGCDRPDALPCAASTDVQRVRLDVDGVNGLLSRSAGGDRLAFAELYDVTSARVFGLTLRVLGDRRLAEDCTLAVYLQIWGSAAASFDATGELGWSLLMTLAHRRAVDRLRYEQRGTDRHGGSFVATNLPEFDQMGIAANKQALREARHAVSDLQWESFAMAYYGGRTYREVAWDLGVAVPVVKSHIRAGLKRLRECPELA
jgi:RNA polymerase sigma-70 factor (ECF subfamily)